MDITIQAPQHRNFNELQEHYKTKIMDKFNQFDFIVNAELHVGKTENEQREIKLMLKPKRGNTLMAQDISKTEDKAFSNVVQKLKPQIEKYKNSQPA